MDRADRGVAPGQFGVLYDGEVCLGAGMILD
jgi:tRNA U34 2-thiouridine synthase MnmA/TrmU